MDLPAWTQLVSQHNRLIELDTALPQAFVVERFQAREAVSEPFVFELDCLSPNAFIDLRPLLATELTLRLRTPAGQRLWHGYCTQAAQLGSEGGLARYRLRMEPWTAFLQLRRNFLIYQDVDERGIVERLFAHYPQANYRFEAARALQSRPIRTQWESDFDFFERVLAEAGMVYRFEHAQSSESGDGGQRARHSLVIYDAQAAVPDVEPAAVRFHRIDATEQDDAIVVFTDRRQVAPSAASVASWQPEQLVAVAARAEADAPSVAGLEVYDPARSGVFAQGAAAQDIADLRLAGLQLPARLHDGAGAARQLAPGQGFTLAQHPALSGQRFIPLVIEHSGVNNLGSDAVALLQSGELERGDYRNRFTCIPAEVALAPAFVARPTAPGPQTARVVGLPDARITSTRDHQVRIQFDMQRGAAPNPGGLTETGGNDAGHAPGDAGSGFWVPVGEWLSGANYGSHFLPRVNSEVLVDFLHGDLDQPLIVAQLYNGEHLPPFAAGVDSSANHSGVLSGLHTQGLDGQTASRWVLDDAPGQPRHELHTELAASALAVGWLIDQDGASRGPLRGEGFEVRTQGWTVQRAGEGFLISTSARAKGASTQLDAAEAVERLAAAKDTASQLAQMADQVQAIPLAANERQAAFLQAIDPAQDGKYTEAVNGQAANKPGADGRTAGDPVERFASPVLLQEGPSHLVYATPNSALAFASGAQHWTVQHDAHLAAGATFSSVSGMATGVLAQNGPLQLIAAHGPVSLQAHASTLELLAEQDLTVTSTEDTLEILAQSKVTLQGGQSSVVLEGQNITFICLETFKVKASQHPLMGGESQAATLQALPEGLAGQVPNWMELNHHWPDLTPVAGAAYRVAFADGTVREGKLDGNGFARLEGIPSSAARVYFGEDPRSWQPEPVQALTVTNEAILEDARKLGLESDDEIAELIKAAAYRTTETGA